MIKILFNRFVDFVKNPNNPYYPELTDKGKLQHVVRCFLPICIVIASLLGILIDLSEQAKLFDTLVYKDYSFWFTLVAAVLIAPPLEELIFRGFLGKYRNKSYFKWLYYLSTLLFGVVHISNYENSNSLLPFFLIITGPQIFLGLLFGYIRIVYGFKYAVFLHAIYNLFMICLGVSLEYLFVK